MNFFKTTRVKTRKRKLQRALTGGQKEVKITQALIRERDVQGKYSGKIVKGIMVERKRTSMGTNAPQDESGSCVRVDKRDKGAGGGRSL